MVPLAGPVQACPGQIIGERQRAEFNKPKPTSIQTSTLDCLLRDTIKNRVLYFTFPDNQKSSVVKCHVTYTIITARDSQDLFNYGYLNNNDNNERGWKCCGNLFKNLNSKRQECITCDALSVRETNKVRICDKHNTLVAIHWLNYNLLLFWWDSLKHFLLKSTQEQQQTDLLISTPNKQDKTWHDTTSLVLPNPITPSSSRLFTAHLAAPNFSTKLRNGKYFQTCQAEQQTSPHPWRLAFDAANSKTTRANTHHPFISFCELTFTPLSTNVRTSSMSPMADASLSRSCNSLSNEMVDIFVLTDAVRS